MIYLRKDYGITCNKCGEPLEYPMDDPTMISHRGHSIYEDTRENIKEVAKDYGWDNEKELCTKCKD
jgi:hypothetical protein|tara:strand:- start:127 stop:324 length:198 start_codon:yes stop_codon:yes gene_type:complete